MEREGEHPTITCLPNADIGQNRSQQGIFNIFTSGLGPVVEQEVWNSTPFLSVKGQSKYSEQSVKNTKNCMELLFDNSIKYCFTGI